MKTELHTAQKQAGEVANLKAEISRLKEAEQGLQDAKERCDAHERSKAEYKLKIDKLSQEKQSLMSERNQLELKMQEMESGYRILQEDHAKQLKTSKESFASMALKAEQLVEDSKVKFGILIKEVWTPLCDEMGAQSSAQKENETPNEFFLRSFNESLRPKLIQQKHSINQLRSFQFETEKLSGIKRTLENSLQDIKSDVKRIKLKHITEKASVKKQIEQFKEVQTTFGTHISNKLEESQKTGD